MLKTLYIPAVIGFTDTLAGTVSKVKAAGASSDVQSGLLKMVSTSLESIVSKTMKLEEATVKAQEISETVKKAESYRDNVFVILGEVRKDVDAVEKIMPASAWPVPTYADMLFKL
jgi:glutamine synthetase